MYIGYARVSTTGKDLATQKDLIEKEGCEKVFVEKVTGISTASRKALKNVQNHVRNGDTVIVTKIDRLARSIIDLNHIISDLTDTSITPRYTGLCMIKNLLQDGRIFKLLKMVIT